MSDQEWIEYNVTQEKRFKAIEDDLKSLKKLFEDEKPADVAYLEELDEEIKSSTPEAPAETTVAPVVETATGNPEAAEPIIVTVPVETPSE